MGANTEILFKLKMEDICRKHALEIDKHAELAIHLRNTVKTDREREYWFQMLLKLDKVSNGSVKNAEEFHEFKIQTKSTQLSVTELVKIPETEKGPSTEVAIRAAPPPVQIKAAYKPWIIRLTERLLNLAAKLITWDKRS